MPLSKSFWLPDVAVGDPAVQVLVLDVQFFDAGRQDHVRHKKAAAFLGGVVFEVVIHWLLASGAGEGRKNETYVIGGKFGGFPR